MKHLLENYIKLMLKENINKPKTLHIFDFDHTLYDPDTKEWLQDIVYKAKKSYRNPETITILCTARDNRFKKEALNLLKQENILFDHYFFNSKSETDYAYKKKEIKNFLETNPQISSIIFYDDLEENLEAVKSIIDKNIYYRPVKMPEV